MPLKEPVKAFAIAVKHQWMSSFSLRFIKGGILKSSIDKVDLDLDYSLKDYN